MESEEEPEEELDMDHGWNFKYNRRLSCFSHSVSTVTFSQDGRYLVSATGTGDVKVWDTGNWAEAAKLKGCRREEPRALTISPGQRWLVCAYPSIMHIFDCQPPWRLEHKISAPLDMCTKEPSEWCCVTFSPLSEVDHPGGKAGQDNHLAAFSSDALSVFDYSGGWGEDTPRRTVSNFTSGRPTSITYTSCGSWLLVAYESGELQIWNHFSLTLEKSLKAHSGPVLCVTASPRGACYDPRFVSCGTDQSLRVWHSFGWLLEQIVPDTKADRNGVRACQFSCSGNWIVSVACELCIWSVCVSTKGKMQLRLHQRLAAVCGAEGLRTAAFCSRQDSLAVGSRDGVLGLFTKQPGAPPDLPRSDAKDWETKPADHATTAPWIMSRPLARPMKKLSPDGLMPKKMSQPPMPKQNWALRTHMRSLSMTTPGSLSMTTGSLSMTAGSLSMTMPPKQASPGKMRSVSQAGCAALQSPKISDSRSETPPSVTAKLIAVRDRARKAPVVDNPLFGDGDTAGDSRRKYLNKSKSSPELKRWKSGSFEAFGDVLTGYVPARSGSTTPAAAAAGLFSPPAKKRSAALACGDRSDTVSDAQKSALYASRTFVQRISLDPQAIC